MAAKKPTYPLVNGVRHSFASVQIQIGPVAETGQTWITAKGFTAVNFKRTRERGELRGPHPDPEGKTQGSNKYELKITFGLAEVHYLFETVLGGQGYGDLLFPVQVQFFERQFDLVKYDFSGCSIDTDGGDNAQGVDATVQEIDFKPLLMVKNGHQNVANPLNAA